MSDPWEVYQWAGFDPALTWDGFPPSIGQWPSPSSEFPTVLPCTVVQYEPEWATTEAAVINHVRIGYGAADPQTVVNIEDAASITAHGRRYLYQGTDIATVSDANNRATHIISTQSVQRWALGDVIVNLADVDAPTRTALLTLICGDHVTVQGFPQPAPAQDWTGITEGWTYTLYSQAGQLFEQMNLSLSDQLHSLAVMTWNDYTAVYTWDQHPAYLTWDDLNDVSDTQLLEAAA